MFFFDIITVAVVIWMIISGIKSGLISQLLTIAGIAIGILLAYNYGEGVGLLFGIDAEFAAVAGFAIILIASVIVAALVAIPLSKVISFVGLSWVNKLVGAVFAVIKGLVVLGLLYSAIFVLNDHFKIVDKQSFNKSISFNIVRKATQPLIDYWGEIREEAIKNAKL